MLLIESEMDALAILLNYGNNCRHNIYVDHATSKCSKVLTNAHTRHAHTAANGVFKSYSMYSLKKMKEFSLQVV